MFWISYGEINSETNKDNEPIKQEKMWNVKSIKLL